MIDPDLVRLAVSSRKAATRSSAFFRPSRSRCSWVWAEADHGQIEQVANEARRAAAGVEQALPFIGDHLHRRDRFGRGVVQIVGLEAEHVSRHMKGADLPAAVGKQLADPDHAGNDLVDVTRRLALGVDFGVAAEAHDDAESAEAGGFVGALAAERKDDVRLVVELNGVGGLRQHRGPPLTRCLTPIGSPMTGARKFVSPPYGKLRSRSEAFDIQAIFR